jgi:hypothetical protein
MYTIGRVIVDGKPPAHDTPATSERILLDALSRCWPENARVKFLITPGGFVKSNRWPSTWSGKKAWESRPSDVVDLIGVAEGLVKRVVTKRVLAAASGTVLAEQDCTTTRPIRKVPEAGVIRGALN